MMNHVKFENNNRRAKTTSWSAMVVRQGSLFPPMVGGKFYFEKKIPPMGEGLGGKLSPPWAGGWGGSFRYFPPTMGGK